MYFELKKLQENILLQGNKQVQNKNWNNTKLEKEKGDFADDVSKRKRVQLLKVASRK